MRTPIRRKLVFSVQYSVCVQIAISHIRMIMAQLINLKCRQMTSRWRDKARCRELGLDPELFFEADNNRILRDRLLYIACAPCPVRTDCLRENLTNPDGMYGGYTRKQRHRLAARMGIPFTRFTQFFDCKMATYDREQAVRRTIEANSHD